MEIQIISYITFQRYVHKIHINEYSLNDKHDVEIKSILSVT